MHVVAAGKLRKSSDHTHETGLRLQVECILAGKLVRKRDRGGSKGRGGGKARGGRAQKHRGGVRVRERREHRDLRPADDPDPAPVVPDRHREKVIEKFSAKRPVYSNCRMLARDGGELAACDLKKLQWYVSKGIAEWVEGCGEDTEQPTIRLNFEHKQDDQALGTSTFYTEAKENRCVGCGEAQHYLKYRCVSREACASGAPVATTALCAGLRQQSIPEDCEHSPCAIADALVLCCRVHKCTP